MNAQFSVVHMKIMNYDRVEVIPGYKLNKSITNVIWKKALMLAKHAQVTKNITIG